tara:strand:- start:126 stop:584 length:459 start_codon:yes stop_codon:yes gene_type:complete
MPSEVILKDMITGNNALIEKGRLKVDAELEVGELEIGKVVIKDDSTEDTVAVNTNNSLKTIEEVPGTPYTNQFTVTTAGTAVQLQTSANLSLTIKALAGNTGLIYVGDSTVDSSTGFELSAGDSVSLAISQNDVIWLDCSVNGEGVSVIAVS